MIYDLIIIGAGPAGMSAAVYAARKRLRTLIISKDIGGQVSLSSNVENYLGFKSIPGYGLSKKFEEHIDKYDIKVVNSDVKGIIKKKNFVVNAGKEYESKAVIVATGAKPRKLNVKGEDKFYEKGLTYCATCDAPLFKDKIVAVIGGGNSALDAVLQLILIAKKIFLVQISDCLTADSMLVEKAKKSPKVEVMLKTKVKEIFGDKMVNGIVVETGGKEKKINVDGVFVEIGYIPVTDFVKAKKNKCNEIIVNENNGTNIKGLFAAGDCSSVPEKQAIIAAGEGAKAAISVFRWLSKR